MTDIVFNAKSSTTLRRVRLKPSLSSSALLCSSSNCYLNSTPINNFVLPPSPPPCVFSSPSSLNMVKSADSVLKPSLRKMKSTGPESNATTAIIKSVHFNDPLTRVVHFYTPPLDEYDEDDDEEETEEEDDDEEKESKLEDAFLELYRVNSLQEECDSLAVAQQPTSNTLATNHNRGNGSLSLPNWPSTNHPARRFISQMVSLESLVWNQSLQAVQGRVLVHNLAFEKKVTVRCSFDDWKTWTDIDAYYKESAFHGGLTDVNNSAFDRFMFELHVPNVRAFSCNMAVRYQTLGQEFWDNNNRSNFIVQSTPLGSTLGEKPLSLFKAIMQHEHNNSNNNNNINKGVSIMSTFNFMEYHHDKGSNRHQENIKQSCIYGSRDDIVSQQQPTAKTTAESKHSLDRSKFSKYGASRIPAVPSSVSKRSMMQQQQHQMADTQLIVVDLSEQQTGNCNDTLIRSRVMDNHDEAIDLTETIYV
ncbi:hypothetical protein MAM1_0421c10432 [Mucor ambiguus]|uniref:CBM21 domain-containing protein n=1 Tax=Mucor ambiguus TaxID=91626 RepID=A0A0C9N492_9FUNG|nr:hypothetical protein MAM1_0421c10432 [Mucor ambiguus]